jgi:hypothetical protein
MQISARVVEDSVANGVRLTTIEVTFHRFVLAEFNTHRVFSRNSASSRAIPVKKQLERLMESPAWPVSWPREQPGMQGGTELEGDDLTDAQELFRNIHQATVDLVGMYVESHPDVEHRLHKSVLNRPLEPFMWHTVVVTSTEWDNFFGLRCSPQAQPEIRRAAEQMRDAYQVSVPVVKEAGEWHLPYVTNEERLSVPIEKLRRVSVARCARVSSLHAGEAKDYDKDYRLFEDFTSAVPPHASPLEHVATPCDDLAYACHTTSHGNFSGWHQLRHLVGA